MRLAFLVSIIVAGLGCAAPDAGDASPSVMEIAGTTALRSIPAGAHGLAVDSNGRIFIADTFGTGRVLLAADLLSPFTPVLLAGLQRAAGIRIEGDTLLVCDLGAGRVVRYDGAGSVAQQWTVAGPWNVTRLSDGRLAAVTHGGELVFLHDDGSVTVAFTGLDAPFAAAADDAGNVYVTEQGTTAPGAVTLRSGDGAVLTRIEGPWDNPEGIVRDASGRLFIADTAGDRVLIVDPKTGARTFRQIGLPICLAETPRGIVVTARTATGPALVLITDL
jgi:sugar lactone lactonase YvrE